MFVINNQSQPAGIQSHLYRITDFRILSKSKREEIAYSLFIYLRCLAKVAVDGFCDVLKAACTGTGWGVNIN